MRYLAAILSLLVVSACGVPPQYGDSQSYLEGYTETLPSTSDGAGAANGASATGKLVRIDQDIVKAAQVAPLLSLPGHFGIARIQHRQVSAIPPNEMVLWRDFAADNKQFGTFVPLSPLVAEFAWDSMQDDPDRRQPWNVTIGETVRKIRLGAARQHVDAVLVYEVSGQIEKTTTPLAVFDLTLIGGIILPTRSMDGHAVAHAMLLDPRSGFVYGTTSESVAVSELTPSWGSDHRKAEMNAAAGYEAVVGLVGKVETMAGDITRALERSKARSAEAAVVKD